MEIEAAVGGWRHSPQGKFSYKGKDFLDLKSDLDFDDHTDLSARLKIVTPPPIPNVYLTATRIEHDKTPVLADAVGFGDIVILPDIPFDARFKIDQYDLALYYDLPFLKGISLNTLNAELGVNVRLIDAEAAVSQNTGMLRLSESDKETWVAPMIYLGVQVRPVRRLSIEAEARGVDFHDDRMLGLIGRVKVFLWGPAFAAGGYRYESDDVEESDFIADVDFSGPFLEAGVQF